MEKYGFIYIWRDRKKNMYYIGSHWGTEDDGYICSSNWMRTTYSRRSHDFKRRILEIVEDREQLYNIETKWLQLAEKNKDRYYNRNFNANHWTAYPESVKTVPQRISYKTKEAMQLDDVRQNYLEGIKERDTKSSHEDVRRKRSESMKQAISGKQWPLNPPPNNKDKVRLWKEGKYKLVMKDSDKYYQLNEEGWKEKADYLNMLVEKFRYETNDHESDLQALAKRMINVGYISDKDYYRYLQK